MTSDVGKYLYLDALIADMRQIEAEYSPSIDGWSDTAIAGIYGANPEVERLTSPTATDPEVSRLAAVADEVQPKT